MPTNGMDSPTNWNFWNVTGTDTPHGRAGYNASGPGARPTPARSNSCDTGDEYQRIRFLVDRDGPAAARDWVERTLTIYREAANNPRSHASTPNYRPLFRASIEAFEQWLAHPPEDRETP